MKQKINRLQIICIAVAYLCVLRISGQVDSLIFDTGKQLVGEIKKMEKGVLEIDVPFGDQNFKVKWAHVKEIYTHSKFLVGLKDKTFQGVLTTGPNGTVDIIAIDTIYHNHPFENIVYLSQFKEGFFNRFSAALEVGFNITKAQNVRQLSVRSAIGYKSSTSVFNASFNILRASQDETLPIERTDGLLNYTRLLSGTWYGLATFSTLSNTEQLIDIRANTQIGIGKYLITNNKAFWGVKTGINYNLERFSNVGSTRNSWEFMLGTDISLYDVGDFELYLIANGYSGLTDTERYRADINLDIKYDLPWNLFVRLGSSVNYDNRQAENASETDFIIRTGIGWEW